MVKDLGIDEQDASFYAGLLVSAYAVAEALTSMAWGVLSDRIGRKPVVLFGLVGVGISSLIFGLAEQYWVALLARFVGGALNGNVSVMQTMVAEMVKLPEHEPKAYAVQPFVWTLGGIIGSAMGGFLAQPAVFYPSLFSEEGLFGRFPYLLPNLVSVGVVAIAVIQGIFFLEETNVNCYNANANGTQDDQDDGSIAVVDAEDEDEALDETTPLFQARRRSRGYSTTNSASISRPRFAESSLPLPVEQDFIDLRRGSFGTVHSIKLPVDLTPSSTGPPSESGSFQGKTFNFKVIMYVVALLIFSYHQMAASSLLPTHLLDKPEGPPGQLDLRGGLGYTVHDVGVYLAVNGVLALFIQAVVFPMFVERVGIWHSFTWMIMLYPIAYTLMPFLSALPPSLTSAGIYFSLFMQSFFGLIVSPVALILLKDAAPSPQVLGKVNGFAMSGACLARTVAPPLAGVIYSFAGSAVAWLSCVAVALVGVVQLFWVPRRRSHNDHGTVGNAIM
ncbi:hypothetical protein FZEAL_2518 [Fusarium zealandicum]|uniref:Major facilitator superfamily (MFS) profile domain-containing protein n=1 Tax=Fusarium zealandicum TaxID=1053134 RepID=A0A8H4UQU8_9HYPO|nr:hypothetical protein FZEAL_2518 [Fusarium zealandicum]